MKKEASIVRGILTFSSVFFILILSFLPAPPEASADLTWKYGGTRHNLTQIGIFKGLQLPLAPDVLRGISSTFGGTIFPDPPPPNKLLLINYHQFSHYDHLKDGSGSEVPHNFSASIFSAIFRFMYTSSITFADGRARLMPEIVIPWATARVKVDGEVSRRKDIGDIKLGLGTFWKNIFSIGGLDFDSFMGLEVTLPTAKHRKEGVSIGANIYDTLFFFETLTKLNVGAGDGLFWKNHFQFNYYGKNRDFINPVTLDRGSEYQCGPNFQYNLALAYKFNKKIGGGISGFYNQQISADEMDGKKIRNSKERAVGVGPIVTIARHPLEGSLKTLFVLDAENNPEGTVTTLILNFLF